MADGFVPSYATCSQVTAQCPVSATTYGYIPVLGGNAFLAALFGILLILGLGLGIKERTWTYSLFLGIGTLLETAGYVGRLLMNQNPWDKGGFQMQIICLILAPTFIAASIYLSLKHLVIYFGHEYSWLPARLYPWIFVGCDIGSIVIQAAGGGIAAAAGSSGNPSLLQAGNDLMIAGIAFQVATMAVCGLLVATFWFRYHKAKKANVEIKSEYSELKQGSTEKMKLKIFCISIVLAYISILIRCIYRLPEMAGGWGNPLMQNEKEFLVLDGTMIAIASLVLTVIHPAVFFKKMYKPSKKTFVEHSES